MVERTIGQICIQEGGIKLNNEVDSGHTNRTTMIRHSSTSDRIGECLLNRLVNWEVVEAARWTATPRALRWVHSPSREN
jgi:hypothetical protein